MITLHTVSRGGAVTHDGRYAVLYEEDPGIDEWEQPRADPVWYIVELPDPSPDPTTWPERLAQVSLEDAVFESAAFTPCRDWLKERT